MANAMAVLLEAIRPSSVATSSPAADDAAGKSSMVNPATRGVTARLFDEPPPTPTPASAHAALMPSSPPAASGYAVRTVEAVAPTHLPPPHPHDDMEAAALATATTENDNMKAIIQQMQQQMEYAAVVSENTLLRKQMEYAAVVSESTLLRNAVAIARAQRYRNDPTPEE